MINYILACIFIFNVCILIKVSPKTPIHLASIWVNLIGLCFAFIFAADIYAFMCMGISQVLWIFGDKRNRKVKT
jgi:hypothetical protein